MIEKIIESQNKIFREKIQNNIDFYNSKNKFKKIIILQKIFSFIHKYYIYIKYYKSKYINKKIKKI